MSGEARGATERDIVARTADHVARPAWNSGRLASGVVCMAEQFATCRTNLTQPERLCHPVSSSRGQRLLSAHCSRFPHPILRGDSRKQTAGEALRLAERDDSSVAVSRLSTFLLTPLSCSMRKPPQGGSSYGGGGGTLHRLGGPHAVPGGPWRRRPVVFGARPSTTPTSLAESFSLAPLPPARAHSLERPCHLPKGLSVPPSRAGPGAVNNSPFPSSKKGHNHDPS